MFTSTQRIAMMVLAAVLTVGPVSEAFGQDEQAAPVGKQWQEMLHYISVARPELAKSFADAILADPDATPKQLYLLSTEYVETLRLLEKAQNNDELKDIATQLLAAIEEGYKAWRSDPEQVAGAIEMLGGTLEGYRLASERLKESGEYAVPMLIQRLMAEGTSEKLRTRIVTVLPVLGKQAVRPYCEALKAEDLRIVQWVANALAAIEYPHALPALRQALQRPDVEPTSEVAQALTAAMIACGGGNTNVLQRSAAELWFELGNKYYYRAESLQPDSRYPNEPGLVWFWKEGLGVEARPVPREIFNDVYAMRCARMTLQNDPSFHAAVPLWIASALRRQIELPDGETDPLWPADAQQSDYYALATSPQYLQVVLQRALMDNDVPLAKRVIETLGKTTGAESLLETLPGGAQPLVATMSYPDRSLRFLAAETLALAKPNAKFLGSQMVLDQLSLALRQTGQKYALIIVKDEELRGRVMDAARAADFEVVVATHADEALPAAQKVIGLDVIFIGPDIDPVTAVNPFRREMVYAYVPAIVNRSGDAARQMAATDERMTVLDPAVADEETMIDAFGKALASSAGQPMTDEQANAWAVRAAMAIETIATCPSAAYDVATTVDALVQATQATNPDLQIAASNALAAINTDAAQQALATLALNAGADEQVRIAAFKAATASVREFGKQVTDAQAQEIVTVVTGEGSQDLLDAAAQLLGALNLPSQESTRLILQTDTLD